MYIVLVLTLPNFDNLFVVESDASGIGLGALMMQDKKPISYLSQTLTENQRQKSVYERELMVIVFAI